MKIPAHCQSKVNQRLNHLTVTPISNFPYRSLLKQFPSLTNRSFRVWDIKHTIIHRNSTTGPPKSCRPRLLAWDRLKITKAECKHMLGLGIIRQLLGLTPLSCSQEDAWQLVTMWRLPSVGLSDHP
uniref:Uncharacterized protein n=1 Tax=Schistocephalus solidus TaxID=70667 RepID=A0A0X3Q3B7_SCHSO